MSCLISVVSEEGMSSLLLIGADRADPMPSKNERQGQSANIFFSHKGSLQGRNTSIFVKRCIEVGALVYGNGAITPSCSPYFYNLLPHPFRSGWNRQVIRNSLCDDQ